MVRHYRVRCRSCSIRGAVRYCPGLKVDICPICCERMRPNLSACSSCKYYLLTLPRSREIPEPEPKFIEGFVSDSERAGLLSLALAFQKPNGRLKAMFFLLDFWKSGMKHCFVTVDMSKEDFYHKCAIMAEREAKKININDAKKLIQRGLFISNAIKAPIPEDYQRWKYLLGDMNSVPNPAGSIYKCARCNAELADPVMNVIKKYAQSDDVNFYIVCGKCAGEFED